MDIVVTP